MLGNLTFSIILTLAGFSTYIINDNWPEITIEKQTTTVEISIIPEKILSYADKFFSFKELLIRSYGLSEKKAEQFADWILISTLESSLEPETIAALIMTESSFRYKVKSHVGAVGPAQVIPFFWKSHCTGDLENDPQMNISCGVFVLERYKKRCKGDLMCAFAMYNVGPTNFYKEKYSGAKKRYIKKINTHKNQILAFKNNNEFAIN